MTSRAEDRIFPMPSRRPSLQLRFLLRPIPCGRDFVPFGAEIKLPDTRGTPFCALNTHSNGQRRNAPERGPLKHNLQTWHLQRPQTAFCTSPTNHCASSLLPLALNVFLGHGRYLINHLSLSLALFFTYEDLSGRRRDDDLILALLHTRSFSERELFNLDVFVLCSLVNKDRRGCVNFLRGP